MMNGQEQCYIHLMVHLTKFNFFHLTQGKQPSDTYYQHFNTILRVLEEMPATVWDDPGLIQEWINAIATMSMVPSAAETRQAKAEAKQQYLAIAFLMGSDRTHYGPLLIEMENSYLQQINWYPTTLMQAYNDLNNYWPDTCFLSQNKPGNDGITFHTIQEQDESNQLGQSH